MNLGKQFKEGLLTQNPVLVQVLGMCSTMAITTSFFNGLGMGVAVTIILTLSNVIISAMRKIIPDKIRIAMFIVVIAGFVTCVDLLHPGVFAGPGQLPGRVHPPDRGQLHHPGPCGGLLLQERHCRLLLGRHLPGHRLYLGAAGHVHHP